MRLSAKERFLDAIGSALAGRGIARGDVDSVEFQTGRNFSAHVTLLNGEKLYAKQLRGADCEQRLLRTVRFNSWFAESTPGFSSPSLLGHDYDSRTVIYEYVPSSQKLEEEISTSRVEMSTLQEVAKVLAEFHGASIDNHDDFDKSLPNYPPAGMAAIPMGYFENATMGELDLWRLVQGDGDLQQSLHSLVTEDSPRTLIHGDFRSDQVLLHGDGISLIDWEEFRLGDPARDLGGFLGEIFYHGIRSLATGATSDGSQLTEEGILDRGAELLEEIRPRIQTCWHTYLSCRMEMAAVSSTSEVGAEVTASSQDKVEFGLDSSLSSRTLGFMGWHMFDRSLVSTSVAGRLSAHDRALSGIGRNMILHRDEFIATLGLERMP